jgi:hypothetical protein
MTFPVFAGNSASTGYNLTRSLRFRRSASAYLNRTPASATNRQKFTISVWYKAGGISASEANANILNAGGDGSSVLISGTGAFGGTYQDRLLYREGGTTLLYWPMVFRDPASWYHIVFAMDTTQATAANRTKLYVNGVDQGAFSGTAITQNASTSINNTSAHYINTFNGASYPSDLYYAEYNFVDGQQLTPSSFGSTNALTGVWQPAAYTGSYGTNGFYLPFTDNSALTTSSNVGLGKDFSGNGNYWTTNNISLTGGTIQSFTTVGTTSWTAPAGVTQVNYLVVAGGGAGKTDNGGGGGAGGLLQGQLTVIPGNSYTVTVGAGGTAGTTPNPGGNSVFSSLTAIGGGGGSGQSGGSGGGAGGNAGSGGAGTSGQGSAGGSATSPGNGGGGGANAVGGNGTGSGGGAGGAGATSSITGTAVVYAGGGGGGSVGGTAGAGGSGGGGAGTADSSTATAGTANRGAGGGGGGYSGGPGTGGAGGSGIVIISYGAGVTYDSMTDVPTLTSATASNFAVMNPLVTPTSGSLSSGNLNSSQTYQGFPSTIAMSSGQWYWEITGLTNTASNNMRIGIAPQGYTVGIGTPGDLTGSYAYTANATKGSGGTYVSYGASYTDNDVIGVAFDATNGTLVFYKNGTSQGTAYTGISGTFFALTGSGSSATMTMCVNFGQRAFAYSPPTGFVALNTYNLPTSTIVKGNTVMDATLWAGNSSTQSIVNAAAFKTDFVWIKNRTGGNNHALFDSVRGATKRLYSDSTIDEQTEATTLTAFNSNGFSVSSSGAVNASANNYVGWQWQAGQGSSSSNTNGTITSTVSVNASAGFSVVTWTGTGANATVGHGLGVAPQLIINKPRNAADNWISWHTSLGALGYIYLNLTNASASAATVWNSTLPTSSVFSVGTSSNINSSAQTMVSYCWTPIAGYSAFGSYTGNGSTDGPFVYTGFRPRFILYKPTNVAGTDWVMWDTARTQYNVLGNYLLANTSGAEGTATVIDILSNGFKMRIASTGNNGSGDNIVYAAFAENPFRNSLAR